MTTSNAEVPSADARAAAGPITGLRADMVEQWQTFSRVTAVRAAILLLVANTVFLLYCYLEVATPHAMRDVVRLGAASLLLTAGLLAISLVEEIVFRHWLLSRLRSLLPGWAANLAQATLFASLHLLEPGMASVGLLGIFLLGFVAGDIMLRAGSLALCVLTHWAWNLIVLLSVHLPLHFLEIRWGDALPMVFLAATLTSLTGVLLTTVAAMRIARKMPTAR